MKGLLLTERAPRMRATIPGLAVLALALTLVLFPFGWLGEIWRPFGRVLDDLFPTAWEHAFGHATLFGLLGLAALLAIPALRYGPWRYLGLLLMAGVGQEAFQALYKGRVLLFDDLRDLATDLAGLLLALAIVWVWMRLRKGRGAGCGQGEYALQSGLPEQEESIT